MREQSLSLFPLCTSTLHTLFSYSPTIEKQNEARQNETRQFSVVSLHINVDPVVPCTGSFPEAFWKVVVVSGVLLNFMGSLAALCNC